MSGGASGTTLLEMDGERDLSKIFESVEKRK